MKLLIAIHVSFCDSYVNRWTGCSTVFLEAFVHFKNEALLEECCMRVRICTSIHPYNFMGW